MNTFENVINVLTNKTERKPLVTLMTYTRLLQSGLDGCARELVISVPISYLHALSLSYPEMTFERRQASNTIIGYGVYRVIIPMTKRVSEG